LIRGKAPFCTPAGVALGVTDNGRIRSKAGKIVVRMQHAARTFLEIGRMPKKAAAA
jgi:hypothetical protein